MMQWDWAPPPPQWTDGQTDTTENNTFPQTTYAGGENLNKSRNVRGYSTLVRNYTNTPFFRVVNKKIHPDR